MRQALLRDLRPAVQAWFQAKSLTATVFKVQPSVNRPSVARNGHSKNQHCTIYNKVLVSIYHFLEAVATRNQALLRKERKLFDSSTE